MECSCINIDDYDQCEMYYAKMRKAREKHKCSECGATIKKGELYSYESGRWEDRFETFKTCQDCLSLRDSFFCNGWYYEMVRENIQDFIYDCFGEIPEKSIAQLTPAARAWVCEK